MEFDKILVAVGRTLIDGIGLDGSASHDKRKIIVNGTCRPTCPASMPSAM